MEFINSLPGGENLWVGGDFNCHNVVWGSQRTDAVGEEVFVEFSNSDLLLLNDGTRTYIDSSSGLPSCLYLSFVSPNLKTEAKWVVLVDNLLSDHFPIVTLLDIQSPIVMHKSHRYKLSKVCPTGWLLFTEELDRELIASPGLHGSSPVNEYNRLCRIIHRTVERSFLRDSRQGEGRRQGRGQGRKRKVSRAPWWNEACEEETRGEKRPYEILDWIRVLTIVSRRWNVRQRRYFTKQRPNHSGNTARS